MSSSSSSQSSMSSSASASRGIHLRRFSQTRYIANAVDGYRFRVVAYGAYDMPNEIFRYLRQPFNPTTGAEADRFDGVCSPADLEEMPADDPGSAVPPFFRLSEIDLVFRSQSEAEEGWTLIQSEVDILVQTLNIMDTMEVTADATFGEPPAATPPE